MKAESMHNTICIFAFSKNLKNSKSVGFFVDKHFLGIVTYENFFDSQYKFCWKLSDYLDILAKNLIKEPSM